MSRLYTDLEAFFRDRGIPKREDGSFVEDARDYGVWWRDRRGGVYRLTWIGAEGRSEVDSGELYLVRLSGPFVGTVSLSEIAQYPYLSFAPGDYEGKLVSTGGPKGPVELLCVIRPLNGKLKAADRDVEAILDGWAEECGKRGSIGWVRDRAMRAVLAGTATDA